MFDVEIVQNDHKIKVLVNGKCARRAHSLETSRMLFKWKDSITGRPFLIKLDKMRHNYHPYNRQSTREAKLYKKIKPKHKKFFPELIVCGKSNGIGFVMQPFYKLGYFDYRNDKEWNERKRVLKIGKKYRLTDLEGHNIGKLPNGQGIIYDFGV